MAKTIDFLKSIKDNITDYFKLNKFPNPLLFRDFLGRPRSEDWIENYMSNYPHKYPKYPKSLKGLWEKYNDPFHLMNQIYNTSKNNNLEVYNLGDSLNKNDEKTNVFCVGNANTNYIPPCSFRNQNNTSDQQGFLQVESLLIQNSVKAVGPFAFQNTYLKEIFLTGYTPPEVGYGMLQGCNNFTTLNVNGYSNLSEKYYRNFLKIAFGNQPERANQITINYIGENGKILKSSPALTLSNNNASSFSDCSKKKHASTILSSLPHITSVKHQQPQSPPSVTPPSLHDPRIKR